MKKKNWALFAITAVLLAIGLIAFMPSSPATEEKPACCQKLMNKCGEKEKTPPDDILMESLSRQFISIIPAGY
ncbi:MAG: hypothetical protein ABJA85_03435 [Bacteroidota bacterium]